MPGARDGISGTPGGRTPGPLRFSLREERFLVRCCSSDAAPLGSQRKETEVGQAVPPPLPSARGGDRHHSVALTLPLKRKQLQRRRRRTPRVLTGAPRSGSRGPPLHPAGAPTPCHGSFTRADLRGRVSGDTGWELRRLSLGLDVPSPPTDAIPLSPESSLPSLSPAHSGHRNTESA